MYQDLGRPPKRIMFSVPIFSKL